MLQVKIIQFLDQPNLQQQSEDRYGMIIAIFIKRPLHHMNILKNAFLVFILIFSVSSCSDSIKQNKPEIVATNTKLNNTNYVETLLKSVNHYSMSPFITCL